MRPGPAVLLCVHDYAYIPGQAATIVYVQVQHCMANAAVSALWPPWLRRPCHTYTVYACMPHALPDAFGWRVSKHCVLVLQCFLVGQQLDAKAI